MSEGDIHAAVLMLSGLGLIGLLYWSTLRLKVAPVPTLPHVRQAVIDILRARIDTSSPVSIAELGAGWGGMTDILARACPHARVTAFEASLIPYLISRLRAPHDRVKVVRRDFFEADLSRFDVLYAYLSPEHMARLGLVLKAKAKPHALVLSNAFAIPGWTPVQTVTVGAFPQITVYAYRV